MVFSICLKLVVSCFVDKASSLPHEQRKVHAEKVIYLKISEGRCYSQPSYSGCNTRVLFTTEK